MLTMNKKVVVVREESDSEGGNNFGVNRLRETHGLQVEKGVHMEK